MAKSAFSFGKFAFAVIFGALLISATGSIAFADTYPVRVSLDPDETHNGAGVAAPENSPISVDGRYFTFASYSHSLVSGDTNNVEDCFVHDMVTGSTTRVSVASDGTEANGECFQPTISGDGRYVTFPSSASNLVPNDTNDVYDIFVHDMLTGSTTRVSVASDGTQANAPFSGTVNDFPSINADGRYVAFSSASTNLVPNDTNGANDIFVHDMLTGSTSRASVASDGSQMGGAGSYSSISPDGLHVAFSSGGDIFVHDMVTGSTTDVSGNRAANPTISADGRYVAFESFNNTTNIYDIIVNDTLTGSTTIAADASIGDSEFAFMSADGRFVAFESYIESLGTLDVYVHDMLTGSTSRESVAADGTQGNNISFVGSVSGNSRYVLFFSKASNLVATDTVNTTDAFITLNPFCSSATNTAPVLTPIGNKTVNEGATLAFTVTAAGANCDNLSYSASNLPSGASFNPLTHVFSWTPSYTQAGSYTNVEFDVLDDGTPVASTTESITITVNNVNRAPVISSIGNKSVDQGHALSFTVSATDPDGDALTYSASNLPAGATFNSGTHVFSWTPTSTQVGTYSNVGFTVTDNGTPAASTTQSITITVNPLPTVTTTSLADGTKTVAYSQFLTASGGTAPLTWAIISGSLPPGLSLNSSTGEISGTPTQAGNSSFTVRVTDSYSETASKALSIHINPH
jgi:Tol biopolymer transport system component